MATTGSGDAVKFVGSLAIQDDLKALLGSFDIDFLTGCDFFKRGFIVLPATTAWNLLEPLSRPPKLIHIKSEKAFRFSKNSQTTWSLKSRGDLLICPDPGSTSWAPRIRNETTPTSTVRVEYFVASKRG